MPTVHRTQLRYVQTVTLNSGVVSGVFGTAQTFRLNSLYDPDFAVGGHQPYGYDQMQTFFNRYLVKRALVELTLTDPSADGLIFGCRVRTPSDPYGVQGQTVDAVAERQGGMTRFLNNTGSQVSTLQFDLPIHEIMGLNAATYSGLRDQTGALVSADPALVSYITFALANNANSNNESLIVQVRIAFDCEFTDRLQFLQS